MVVWRAKVENDWLYRAQTFTERFASKPEEYDAPTCGPGPFSMANADTVSGVLNSAGFEEITLRRCDLAIMIGRDIDEAVEFVMSLGPAGEISCASPVTVPRISTSPSPTNSAMGSPTGQGPMASSPLNRRGSSPP